MKNLMGARSTFPLLMACALIVACGTQEKKDTDAPLYNVVTPEHVATSVPVSISQMKFIPDTVNIVKGDTLVFTNNDVVDHDATALPDSAWASGPLHPGDSWKLVADKSTDYFCSIHVVMRGRINVK